MGPDAAHRTAALLPARLLPILFLSIDRDDTTKWEESMEIIRGKQTSFISTLELADLLAGYEAVRIDIGTGDGRFVQRLAQTCPQHFMIGIDACRENLRSASRSAQANSLFVIANALALPPELAGLGGHITINFPWGSLLAGLLTGEPGLLAGLRRITQPGAQLEIRLNDSALREAGWPLEAGADQARRALAAGGFDMRPVSTLLAKDLRACPTTWAKRLAYGRDPRAAYLAGIRKGG